MSHVATLLTNALSIYLHVLFEPRSLFWQLGCDLNNINCFAELRLCSKMHNEEEAGIWRGNHFVRASANDSACATTAHMKGIINDPECK